MRLDKLTEIKRLVIYFFYDADGIVDRYVPYMLEDLKKNCSEIFVVCNGKLTPEGRDVFTEITPNILVRENKGFDVWAYKAALEQYGWDELEKYDEIIMMNHTIMGPLYPFADVFCEMDSRDLDFWGLNKYHKVDANPYNVFYGYIPDHIQSHFIAVRKSMICSREFQTYWDNRPDITDYADAVGKHEAIFTKWFGDKGFRWDVYVDTSDMEGFTSYPLFDYPVKLIEEKRCPIFKRRNFFHEYVTKTRTTAGRDAKLLMRYLEEKTDYDVGMIWENLLRTCHMADIKDNLNLNYILPTTFSFAEKTLKTVLIIHIYYEDMVKYCLEYAKSMPVGSDLILTTNTEEKKKHIEECLKEENWDTSCVRVLKIENRGRDVSALLVAAAPYVMDYDIACFAHDKKVPQLTWGCSGYEFSERCFQNILASREYVENVMALFAKNPYLGMAFPAPPNHAEYFGNLGYEWGPNFGVTKKLADTLGLNVPMAENKEPVAPLGTMFWFRPKALRQLLEYGWTYQDFPKEPNSIDGTILHGIERIYPFVAQNAGYYSAYIFSSEYAETEITNLTLSIRSLTSRIFKIYGHNPLINLNSVLDYYINNPENRGHLGPNWKLAMKDNLRKKIPKPIWKAAKWFYRLFGGKKWLDETLC